MKRGKPVAYAKRRIEKGEVVAWIETESGKVKSDNVNFLPHGKNKLRYWVNNKTGMLACIWYFLNKRRKILGV